MDELPVNGKYWFNQIPHDFFSRDERIRYLSKFGILGHLARSIFMQLLNVSTLTNGKIGNSTYPLSERRLAMKVDVDPDDSEMMGIFKKAIELLEKVELIKILENNAFIEIVDFENYVGCETERARDERLKRQRERDKSNRLSFQKNNEYDV